MSSPQFARAYESMLALHEPAELRDAREQANTYKRPALRSAFNAGWYAWRHRVRLGDGFTAPYMSNMCRRAWSRGYQARQVFERLTDG